MFPTGAKKFTNSSFSLPIPVPRLLATHMRQVNCIPKEVNRRETCPDSIGTEKESFGYHVYTDANELAVLLGIL
jgi:hypothetical protein